jgi:hypothetical protein
MFLVMEETFHAFIVIGRCGTSQLFSQEKFPAPGRPGRNVLDTTPTPLGEWCYGLVIWFISRRFLRIMHAQLIPLDGGPPITLAKDVTVVGRRPELCDLVIDRNSVSKLHCLLVKTDGLLFIRDLGSTNGTKVNGQRVIRGALLPGDELAFASASFRVHLGPDPQEPADHGATEMLTGFLHRADDESVGLDGDDAPLGEFEEAGSESDVRLLSDDSAV